MKKTQMLHRSTLLPNSIIPSDRERTDRFLYRQAGILLPLALLFSISGCSTLSILPSVQDVREFSGDKDVKHFAVTLTDLDEQHDFKRWSQQHITSNRLSQENEEHRGIPIYEVHYHFLHRSGRFRSSSIAYVLWRRSEESGELSHQVTYLGRGAPMRGFRFR